VKTLWAIAVMSCWPALARAQQPFYTDDADVTAKGKVHIEAFNEFDWLPASQQPHLQQNTINMRVNYGLGHGLELDIDSPLLTILNDASTTPRRPFGIGDTNFGIKYNIREEREGAPAFTVVMYVETPTGDSTTGLGSGLADVWLYGVVQKTIAPRTTLRLNGGYLFTGNTSTGVVGITTARGHVATLGGSVMRSVTEALRIGAEVTAAATGNAEIERAQLQALVGASYAVGRGVGLDLGIIAGHFTASPRVGVEIGFSLDLP
jgi:hypothetical protein